MEEKKICNVCKIEKSIESYYKCKECRNGRVSICKICKQKGLTVNKEDKIHQFNQMWRQSDIKYYNLAGCSPKDYEMMWEILEKIGYDCQGEIHRQFLDRMKFKYDVDIKYRNKPHTTTFDKDGKYTNKNKKPPL